MKSRIILVGKAGSGKDYFRDFLKDHRVLDVSFTTRPKRDGEVEGYTYNFISNTAFNNMLLGEQFYEAVEFNGWQYGTSEENWYNAEVFIMTPSGIGQMSAEDRNTCTIVYFDMDETVRRERLSKRSDADSVERRIEADNKDFDNFSDFDIRITNPKYRQKEILELIELHILCDTL